MWASSWPLRQMVWARCHSYGDLIWGGIGIINALLPRETNCTSMPMDGQNRNGRVAHGNGSRQGTAGLGISMAIGIILAADGSVAASRGARSRRSSRGRSAQGSATINRIGPPLARAVRGPAVATRGAAPRGAQDARVCGR